MNTKKVMQVLYIVFACLASGHWYANSYTPVARAHDTARGNPVSGVIVGAVWPVYASFLLFDNK